MFVSGTATIWRRAYTKFLGVTVDTCGSPKKLAAENDPWGLTASHLDDRTGIVSSFYKIGNPFVRNTNLNYCGYVAISNCDWWLYVVKSILCKGKTNSEG